MTLRFVLMFSSLLCVFPVGGSAGSDAPGVGTETSGALEEACKSGNAESCFALGNQEQTEKRLNRAMTFWLQACKREHLVACAKLGHAMNPLPDPGFRRKLFQKACDGGNLDGCVGIGLMEERAGNREDAERIFSDLCTKGNALACDNKHRIAVEDAGPGRCWNPWSRTRLQTMPGFPAPGVPTNERYQCSSQMNEMFGPPPTSEGKKVCRKLCDEGVSVGCHVLGSLENNGGNTETARQIWRKSCDAGDMYSCNSLGVLESREGNKNEAKRLWERACEEGKTAGCSNLMNLKEK